MQKVYVVYDPLYEEIIAVFSTAEKADKFLATDPESQRRIKRKKRCYNYNEFIIDKESE